MQRWTEIVQTDWLLLLRGGEESKIIRFQVRFGEWRGKMTNSFLDMCLSTLYQLCRNSRAAVRRTELQRTSKFQIDKREAEEKLCLGVRITKEQNVSRRRWYEVLHAASSVYMFTFFLSYLLRTPIWHK